MGEKRKGEWEKFYIFGIIAVKRNIMELI